MRIIAGKGKGTKLFTKSGNTTRPTADRVKEALFSIIGDSIQDAEVLDVFAGSGALGLESLSRGASFVTLCDNDAESIDILQKNIEKTKNRLNENVSVFHMDAEKLVKSTDKIFDIIFLDPPYHENLITPSIKIILENNLLNKDGIIVCEFIEEEINCDLKLIKEKKYGNKTIRIYKNELI